MTPQELKNSILQQAIQGKLVEQRPEEGTAEELFQQIQKEKQRLIAEGKIKKEKPLPEITEDEKPFDIPENWKWVRLGEIFNVIMGQSPSGTSVSENGNGLEFHQGKIYFGDDYLKVSPQITNEITKIAEARSILLCVRAPVGVVNIVQRRICIGRGLCALTSSIMDEKFILYFVRSFEKDFVKKSTGTTFKAITNDVIKNQLFPLPPLAEQKRIVAKIEEILPYIHRYEESWLKLEALNSRFPEDMKKSLLQYAIQGKLVEQRPEEGTAEELFERIQEEKQRLIAEGKIKKEKPLPEITEDEKPFEIPESWKWVRFGDLGSYKKGPFGSALTKSMFVPKGNGAIKVYEQKNAIQKNACIGDYYITREYFDTKMTGLEVLPSDIIVSCAGTIGETYVLPENIEQGIINQALMRMRIFSPIFVPYFLVYFDVMLKQNAIAGSKGSAIKNIPPFEVLKNYLVPLPPLAEQKRIVAKLEQLLPLCERLK